MNRTSYATVPFIGLMILPALVLFGVFFLWPALQGVFFSFFDWRGVGEDRVFIGFDNYVDLLQDPLFQTATINTITILVIGGVLIFGLAFLFTEMLRRGLRGKRSLRAIIFLPNVVATIALTTLWASIYNPQFGLLNITLGSLGFDGLAETTWTAPGTVFWAMLIALVWIFTGFYMVLLLAGTDKIPRELYEAAAIDGAGRFQTFRSITLPLLRNVISVSLVLWGVSAIKIFEFPFAFTGREPVPETYTLSVYLFIMGFGQRSPIFRLGYASAIGGYMLVLTIVVALIIRSVLKPKAYDL